MSGPEGEKASAREREKEDRRILFRIPTTTKQVRSLAGTVNRQKIYWSSRALIGDVYHAAIFSS